MRAAAATSLSVAMGSISYISKLDIGRITDNFTVCVLIAGVRDNLIVPDAVVVLAVRALWENRDGRSGRECERERDEKMKR